MMEKVQFLKSRGYTHAIFGDIFLEDLKRYREDQLKNLGIRCEFPGEVVHRHYKAPGDAAQYGFYFMDLL
jgi:hypothetical protein